MMEGKAAAFGNEDFVMPFTAMGLDTYAAGADAEEMRAKASEILRQNYSLILVAENIAPQVQEVFDAVMKKPRPCVIIVPFTSEPTGAATESLGRMIKMATGINILKA